MNKLLPLILSALILPAAAADDRVGSRFAHLDERDPYCPGVATAKLTTPMWIGEEGVEAVVQLSIDDMGRLNPPFRLTSYAKPPEVYYQFLQPAILCLVSQSAAYPPARTCDTIRSRR